MASPFKKLTHRNWLMVRDQWLDYLPEIDLDSTYPSPTLWQLPDFSSSVGASRDDIVVEYVSGVREAIFREGVILVQKFSYCRQVSQTALEQKRPTWAAIISYEACFYGAKAICYMLGFASAGRSSKSYVDAFHVLNEGSRKKPISRVVLKVLNLQDRLTHNVLWSLTKRLMDTCQFEGELAEIQVKLRAFDWPSFSEFRNSILYDGEFWPLSDDLTKCDLILPNCHPEFALAIHEDCDQIMPFADQYFSALRCQRLMLRLMLRDIADLAPAFMNLAKSV